MRRLFAILFAVLVLNYVQAQTSGTCGDNLTWSLDEGTGTLTITGEGAMYDYDYNDANRAPWYSYRENITSVTIEEGVTSIGGSAFFDCVGLTSIDIPSSVTSIGESAFSYCEDLTSIEIPSSVTSIGVYAFEDCWSLTSINIPAGVTSIGDRAFYRCYGLTSIEIPSSVTSIGDRAFSWCTGLTSIVVGEGNSVYDSRGNCNAIIKTASNTLIAGCKNTIIPSSVTSIGESAFLYCTSLTSIVIPSSVTSIGNYAFYGCEGLTSIVIPEGVTSIGEAAFYSCEGLTSIVIPNSVTSIGESAFGGCSGLTSIVVDEGNSVYDSRGNCNAIIETASNTLIAGCVNTIIPEGVTSIGENAFFSCTGLTSIEIPSSVTSIGLYAFYYCTGLTSIEIPSSVTSIGGHAFADCDGLTSIEIPSSVTSIGYFAFYDCDGLTSIEIPSSVTSIGGYAFYLCKGLTSITSHIAAEDLFVPGSNAFYNIDKAACTLYVPAGAKSTYAATAQWKDFTNIVEADGKCGDNAYWALNEETGVLTITGEGAMYDYANNDANRAPWYSYRENITSVTIEEGVTSIGSYAFYFCTGLTSIEIPSSVTSIGNYAFYYCKGLTSIEIPSSVTSIGNSAFYYCKGLTSIEIPSSVTNIGESAFYYCKGLTSIEIPSSVTSIGESAFSNCTGLTSIVVGEGNTIYDSRGNCNAIIETASNTLIAGCKNTIIPSSVTNIGNQAFFYCTGLTSIEIPSSVTSIGDDAFYNCDGLTSIEIPSSVTSIGKWAFHYCDGLTSIVVDEGNSVYDSRGNCNAIIKTASNTLILGCKNTIIPEGVTSIGNYAFWGCNGLTSIEIPSSVTSIGDYAFSHCSGLTSIEIPSSVTSIGQGAFADCYGLTSIEIPEGVTSIKYGAFSDCTGLTSIEIPSSVTSIRYNAFSGCTGLTSIVSFIAAEKLFVPGNNAFGGIDKDACTLYVPAGAKSTYAATAQWKDFKNIVEMQEVVNIVDGVPYTATEVKENVEVVYSRTFGNTNWQAWYVPFAIDYEQLSDDFEVAEINDIHQYDTDRNGIMDKTELEVVKMVTGTLRANYPYLVRAKEAGKKSITVSDATLEAAKNTVIDCSSVKLKYYFAGTCAGVSGQEMFDGGYYALSSGALMQAADNSVALKPLRWYMRIENRGEAVSAGVIKIRVLGDETTDVREVETEPCGEAVYYDLSGRRVENPTRGIYIVNGKKVYIK